MSFTHVDGPLNDFHYLTMILLKNPPYHIPSSMLFFTAPFFRLLRRNADNPTSRSATGVSGKLALLVASSAQIVGAGMHDDGPAQHALGPDQLDESVGDGALGVALFVGFVVAEVADVADFVGRGTVVCGVGVD